MAISWVDISLLLIFIIGTIVGKKKQIVAEFIYLFGVMCATFVTLHFYSSFAVFLNKKVFIPPEVAGITSFLILSISLIVGFKFIQEGWSIIFKAEIDSSLEKFLSIIIAGARMYLVCGLIFLALLISGNSYTEKSARKSLSNRVLLFTSATFYEALYNGVVVKFFPDEHINSKVLSAVQKGTKSKPKM